MEKIFLVPTDDGWMVLGGLDAQGQLLPAAHARALLPNAPVVGTPGGETQSLANPVSISCPPTDETAAGLGPAPGPGSPAMVWWPNNLGQHWLTGARTELPLDRVPNTRVIALQHFRAAGYTFKNKDLDLFQVSRGDLDHDGTEDLLAEASIPSPDPDKPRPTAIYRLEDSITLLAPEGIDINGRAEIAGVWDPGEGSSLLLLHSFWAGGMGQHLVGFDDGHPQLLGQWVCGT